jgi:hypothetical protein
MIRKITSLLAAFAFAATATLAPAAEARDHRGGDRWEHGRHYDNHRGRGYYRDRHDRGDAVAAGAVGLILGLAIGSLASQPREDRYGGCYDNYRRCAPPPPPRCDDRCGQYQGYDPRYDDRGSAYSEDYGYDPREERSQCMRRERQWDRYARQYVTVDVPC